MNICYNNNEKQGNPLAVFIAWLNIDLGIKSCFFNGLIAYGKTWLQFVFSLSTSGALQV